MKLTVSYIIFLLIMIIGEGSLAQDITVTGQVTDNKDQPLSFANVYVKGTTQGTTTNPEGEYELNLPPGTYTIVFKHIGYKMEKKKVQVKAGEEVQLNATLLPGSVQLSEVVVTPGEDPAYDIIRNAIEHRTYYLNKVKEYSCRVYAKGKVRMNEVPQNYLADRIEIDSSREGLVYLSESVSKLYYKHPNKKHEEMISSKVSGSNQGISFNFIFNRQFSFYENMLDFRRVAPRGIVSPIANNALFYYDYRLKGKFTEHGETINKIKVIPKRSHDPVFQGFIYITDSSWRIHSVDLFVTQKRGIEIFDTVSVKQNYVPVNDSIWRVFSQKFTFAFNMFGFDFNGQYMGMYSKYDLQPNVKDKKFNNEILKVEEEATQRDSLYWAKNRPVKLMAEEKMDYKIKDSLQEVRSSQEYLDSIDAKENKPSVGDILFWGYEYQRSYYNFNIEVDPLISTVQYNTVEGWVFDLDISFHKWFEERDKPMIYGDTYLRYGFSNNMLSGGATLGRGAWSIGAGKTVRQFNDYEPISPFVNTLYTLLGEENHMKVYRETYGKIGYSDEVVNGIEPAIIMKYSKREALQNTTENKWIEYEDKHFTSNQPVHPNFSDQSPFNTHEAFTINMALQVKFAQKYISLPDQKIRLGSKYPKLVFRYRKGVEDVFNSAVNFDFVSGKVKDRMDYNLLGYGSYALKGGTFINSDQTYLMDYYHFGGNQTIFADNYLNKFQLLDYYTSSTVQKFAEAHYQHHFNGFIFNKVPLIRNLNWNVVGGIQAFYTKRSKEYIEANVGIENLITISNIKVGRLDYFTAFSRRNNFGHGLRLRIDITSEFMNMN